MNHTRTKRSGIESSGGRWHPLRQDLSLLERYLPFYAHHRRRAGKYIHAQCRFDQYETRRGAAVSVHMLVFHAATSSRQNAQTTWTSRRRQSVRSAQVPLHPFISLYPTQRRVRGKAHRRHAQAEDDNQFAHREKRTGAALHTWHAGKRSDKRVGICGLEVDTVSGEGCRGEEFGIGGHSLNAYVPQCRAVSGCSRIPNELAYISGSATMSVGDRMKCIVTVTPQCSLQMITMSKHNGAFRTR